MPKYLVTYNVEIEVEADNEEEAIDYAIDEWSDQPDGVWEATQID